MSASLTDAEIAAIRVRCDAATPGPWQRSGGRTKFTGPDGFVEDCLVVASVADNKAYLFTPIGRTHKDQAMAIHDAEFTAHAREDIPRLLDALAAAEAKIAAVAALIEDEDDSFAEELDRAYTAGALQKDYGASRACMIQDHMIAAIHTRLRAILKGEPHA